MNSSLRQPFNLYECMPSEFKTEKRSYQNYEAYKIEIPFRALLIGSTGSGKSNIFVNLVLMLNCFHKIILLVPDADEALYKFLIGVYRKIEKKLGVEEGTLISVVKDVSELPSAQVFKDGMVTESGEELNTLLVFDDFIAMKEAELKRISDLCIRYRKYEVSCLFLTQSYTDTPMLIRKNAEYILIKKCPLKTDLVNILRNYNLDYSKEQLMAFYKSCECNSIQNFFLIDLKTHEPKYRLRKNFEPLDEHATDEI